MDTIPLLSHGSPTAVIAYRAGVAITARRFLSDAERLAEVLPAGAHVLNVCADRYRFTVGLAACLITKRVSLLPSTHTPEVIGQLLGFAPDAFCLTDDRGCDIALPKFYYPGGLPVGEGACAIDQACMLRHLLVQAMTAFLTVLDNSTLADLIAPRSHLAELFQLLM